MPIRTILLVITAVLGITAATPLQAQIFQITDSGTITGAGGIYSDIPMGSTFTFSETFNAATALLLTSDGTSALYVDPDGISSFSVHGLEFTATNPLLGIFSGAGGETPPYGFNFSNQTSAGNRFVVSLYSNDPSVAPSTSLDSLHTSPITDFTSVLNLGTYADYVDGGFNEIGGTNTSFSVEIVSVPEPSSWLLVLMVLPIMGQFRRRWQPRPVPA